MNVIDRIFEVNKHKGAPGQKRIGRLLDLIGNPEEKFRVLHVAGTNGKGSICHFLRSILVEAGYKVGMFTSPHIYSYNERFQVNYDMISDADFERISDYVMSFKDVLKDEGYEYPSLFEILTATAYLYFAEQGVDYMVSEVGLGGRIDSTNTVKKPCVSVIAQVGLDHVDVLGDSLADIAWEKAGIIKPGVPVISESIEPEIEEVIRREAAENNSPFISLNECKYYILEEAKTYEGRLVQEFNFTIPAKLYDGISINAFNHSSLVAGDCRVALECKVKRDDRKAFDESSEIVFNNLRISMLGEHQVRNASIAILALLASGIELSEEVLMGGLCKAVNPGRFEVLDTNPYFIIDGAHNMNGLEASVRTFKKIFGNEDKKNALILFGCFKDKDFHGMITMLGHEFRDCKFIATEPEGDRALDSDVIKTMLDDLGCECDSIHDPSQAYETAISGDYDVIYVLGSIYLISEIRSLKRKEM